MAVRMRTRLTKKAVEAVPVGDKDVVVWDTEIKGFGLKVTPAGRRSYFLYYRARSGQQRRPTIGVHGTLTTEQARQIARQWIAEVTMGADVSATRQAERKAASVADLCRLYVSNYAELHKKPRSVATDRANIENHILPLIGKMPLKDVRRADIERMLLAIREGKTARVLSARPRGRRVIRGGEGIANRVVALVSKMFSCAEGWDLVEGNPARGIRKFRENRKDRFLDIDEIGRLRDVLDSADRGKTESQFVVAVIRFLLLTGMRSGEALNLRWKEVDLSTECLRIADTKTGSRVIPLSSHALAIIQSLPRGTEDELVFQSSRPGRPLALAKPWYRIRAAAKISSDANIHALRHTFASWSVMGGQSLAQVGATLGHKSAQTTLRYADHRLEALREYSQQTGDLFARSTEIVKPLGHPSPVSALRLKDRR
jgi:integrase